MRFMNMFQYMYSRLNTGNIKFNMQLDMHFVRKFP